MTQPLDDATRPGARQPSAAVPLGLALITIGVLLLLDRAQVLDVTTFLRDWWPLALVLPGLWWLAFGARVLGLIAIGAGALLLVDSLTAIDAPLAALIFPLILVVVGIALTRGGLVLRRVVGGHVAAIDARAPGTPMGIGATAVFGDARLTVPDVDDGFVAVGATSVFGDVEVEVPAGWRVTDRTTAVLGDVKVPRDQPSYPEAPVVELHGLVLFGDLRVRYLDTPEVP